MNQERLVYLQKRIFKVILDIYDCLHFSSGQKYTMLIRVETILVFIDTSAITKDNLDFVEERLAEVEHSVFS